MINLPVLKKICKMSIKDFSQYGESIDTPYGDELYYQDNDSNILAIAHLDTVYPDYNFCVWSNDRRYVYSPALDDRLGAYTILDILPGLGINVDTLLTSNEESCMSSGEYFIPAKQYNWIVEFDRAGNDVVLYDYESKRLKKLLAKYGFIIGQGTYSDIQSMQHLKCKGINIGVGYKYQHTMACYADLNILKSQVHRFHKFYVDYKDKRLGHSPSKWAGYKSTYFADDYDYEYDETLKQWIRVNHIHVGNGQEHNTCVECGISLIYKDEFESGYCEVCSFNKQSNFGAKHNDDEY